MLPCRWLDKIYHSLNVGHLWQDSLPSRHHWLITDLDKSVSTLAWFEFARVCSPWDPKRYLSDFVGSESESFVTQSLAVPLGYSTKELWNSEKNFTFIKINTYIKYNFAMNKTSWFQRNYCHWKWINKIDYFVFFMWINNCFVG